MLWNTLGTIQSEQGDLASALTFFDEALRIEPDFAKARYNRANTLHDMGETETALVECELAMTQAQTPSDLAMMSRRCPRRPCCSALAVSAKAGTPMRSAWSRFPRPHPFHDRPAPSLGARR